MMQMMRQRQLFGSSALLTLLVLLTACGGETPTSAPAATATRAASTVSAAGTTGASAATTAATAVAVATTAAGTATGAAAVATTVAPTAQAAGSAAVATGSSVAGTATATRAAGTTTAAAGAVTAASSTGTSAALPTTTTGTVTGGTAAPATAAPAAAGSATTAGATRFAITTGSEGGYTVNEKFAMLPAPSDAVAKTDQVTGQIVLGPNGQVVEGGRIVVNVMSLKSDRDMRDNYIRNNSLESAKFPEAVFVIKSAEGLTGPLGAAAANFKLNGDLTIHGVTKPVTWNATATMAGDTINGTATVTVKMQDFDIKPPMVAVLTTQDTAKLDLKIVAKKA